METINKTRLLLVIVLVFGGGGIFLLQKQQSQKASNQKKQQLPKQEMNIHTKDVSSGENKRYKNIPTKPSPQKPYQTPSYDEKELLKDSVAEGRLLDLELPDPFEEGEIDRIINSANIMAIREAQDKAMSKWPVYSDVQEQLHKEFLKTLDINNLSNEKIIQTAVEFRNNFWQSGGCFSKTSYRSAYVARILLEYGHERNPANLSIIDELIETIQTTNLILKFDNDKKRNVTNIEVKKTLLGLRDKQFKLVQNRIKEGHKPTLKDFACGYDLAYLQQNNDKTKALETVHWLQDMASDGEWTEYDDILIMFEKALEQNAKFYVNIYDVPQENYPDEYRYRRRLPLFRGPETRRAILWPERTFDADRVIEYMEGPSGNK